jgi:hypothetical protein
LPREPIRPGVEVAIGKPALSCDQRGRVRCAVDLLFKQLPYRLRARVLGLSSIPR